MLNFVSQCVTSGFHWDAVENCVQGYFAASSKKLLPRGA